MILGAPLLTGIPAYIVAAIAFAFFVACFAYLFFGNWWHDDTMR